MKKIILSAALAVALASPAMAGSASLTKGGKKYSLKCTSGGCVLSERISMFKSKKVRDMGPGGSANFRANLAKLKGEGYK